MNRKLKATLIVLGIVSAALIVAQLVMGLMIIRAGGEGAASVVKLIKMHQHSGYLTVTVSLIYVVLSISAIAAIPGRAGAGADPVNRA